MRKRFVLMLSMFVISVSLFTACGGGSSTSSSRDWENDVDFDDLDEDEDEDFEIETPTHNRNAEFTVSNAEVTCVIEYDSQVTEFRKAEEVYESMAPAAYINLGSSGEHEVYFDENLGEAGSYSVDTLYQEHTDFIKAYRSDVWISDIREYTADNGITYSCFSTESTWNGTEYVSNFICAQVAEDTMLVITKEDEVFAGDLGEFVESSFYIKKAYTNETESSDVAEISQTDDTAAQGSITITWNSDAAGNISGQPYDLTVLLSGSSNDGSAITCDADGESYLDAQGNLVASVKEIDEQITIEFYHTDMKYYITIENATPDNGWAGETSITCNLPGVTDFDQNNHYYRGATGVWYYSFGVENGVVVPAN